MTAFHLWLLLLISLSRTAPCFNPPNLPTFVNGANPSAWLTTITDEQSSTLYLAGFQQNIISGLSNAAHGEVPAVAAYSLATGTYIWAREYESNLQSMQQAKALVLSPDESMLAVVGTAIATDQVFLMVISALTGAQLTNSVHLSLGVGFQIYSSQMVTFGEQGKIYLVLDDPSVEGTSGVYSRIAVFEMVALDELDFLELYMAPGRFTALTFNEHTAGKVVLGGASPYEGKDNQYVLTFGTLSHDSNDDFQVQEVNVKYESGDKYYRSIQKHHVVALQSVVRKRSTEDPWLVVLTQSSMRETPLKFDYYLLMQTFDEDFGVTGSLGAAYQFYIRNQNPSESAVPIAWTTYFSDSAYPKLYVIFHDSSTGESWYYKFIQSTASEWIVKQTNPGIIIYGAAFTSTTLEIESNVGEANQVYMVGDGQQLQCSDASTPGQNQMAIVLPLQQTDTNTQQTIGPELKNGYDQRNAEFIQSSFEDALSSDRWQLDTATSRTGTVSSLQFLWSELGSTVCAPSLSGVQITDGATAAEVFVNSGYSLQSECSFDPFSFETSDSCTPDSTWNHEVEYPSSIDYGDVLVYVLNGNLVTQVLNDQLAIGTHSFTLAATLPTGETSQVTFDLVVANSSESPECQEIDDTTDPTDPTDSTDPINPVIECSDVVEPILLLPLFSVPFDTQVVYLYGDPDIYQFAPLVYTGPAECSEADIMYSFSAPAALDSVFNESDLTFELPSLIDLDLASQTYVISLIGSLTTDHQTVSVLQEFKFMVEACSPELLYYLFGSTGSADQVPVEYFLSVESGVLSSYQLFTESELAQECLDLWTLSVTNDEDEVFVSVSNQGLLTFFTARTDLQTARVGISISQDEAETNLDLTYTITSTIQVIASPTEQQPEDLTLTVQAEPLVTPANPTNLNNPTMDIAAKLQGQVFELDSLQTTSLHLGMPVDLDGDMVETSVKLSPSTPLVTYDTRTHNLIFDVDQLFQKAELEGSLNYTVMINASDLNPNSRATIYSFTLSVPSLTASELLKYFASLLTADVNKINLDLPHFTKMTLTNKGVATVWFSEDLVQTDLQILHYGLKVTHKNAESNEKVEVTNWNATEFTNKFLKLKVNFDDPLSVSPFGVGKPDELEVRVKIPFLFKAVADGESIPRSSFVRADLPVQLPSNPEQLEAFVEVADVATKISLISTTVVLLSEGALSEMWGMINAMQLLAQIYHTKLYLPSNVQIFFEFLSKISEFSFFDMRPAYKTLFGWAYLLDQQYQFYQVKPQEEEEQEEDPDDPERHLQKKKRPKPTKSKEEEDEEKLNSDIFVNRIGPMLLQFTIFAFIGIYFFLLGILRHCFKQLKPRWKSLKNQIFWNATIRTFLEGYLPFSNTYLTDLRDGYQWNSPLMVVLSLQSIFSLVLIFVMPIYIYKFFRKNIENFRNPRFKRKFGDSTDILDHRSSTSAHFFLWYCFRRLGIMLFIVFESRMHVQVMAIIYIVQFTHIDHGMRSPLRKRSQRLLETFNEHIMFTWCHIMFVFSDFVPWLPRRYEMGNFLIALVCFAMFINYLYLNVPHQQRFFPRIKRLYLRIKKFISPQKKKKEKKKVKIVQAVEEKGFQSPEQLQKQLSQRTIDVQSPAPPLIIPLNRQNRAQSDQDSLVPIIEESDEDLCSKMGKGPAPVTKVSIGQMGLKIFEPEPEDKTPAAKLTSKNLESKWLELDVYTERSKRRQNESSSSSISQSASKRSIPQVDQLQNSGLKRLSKSGRCRQESHLSESSSQPSIMEPPKIEVLTVPQSSLKLRSQRTRALSADIKKRQNPLNFNTEQASDKRRLSPPQSVRSKALEAVALDLKDAFSDFNEACSQFRRDIDLISNRERPLLQVMSSHQSFCVSHQSKAAVSGQHKLEISIEDPMEELNEICSQIRADIRSMR